MQTPYGHLTYCTNIHSGESWEDHFRQLQLHLPQIKKEVAPHQRFGIGLRLSNKASIELLETSVMADFKEWLSQHDLYVFTINGFPYGGFHNTVVKDDVHTPDWLTGERVNYTNRLAHLLADLLPNGMEGSISTSPLSYRFWFADGEGKNVAMQNATKNILAVTTTLIDIKNKNGKLIHLGIEPEPDGLLENGAEFIDWYTHTLLPTGITYFGEQFQYIETEVVEAIKTHVQLCYDVCHFAIGFEQHADYLQQLKGEGIRVSKIQISAALKSNLPADEKERQKVFEAFAAFNEPVYLHQVVAKIGDGILDRYRDLPQALESKTAQAATEWRAHFHVPIFSSAYSVLQSTQSDIVDVLALQRNQPFCKHLEVETYTWEVLSKDLKVPLTDSIIRELQWVLAELEQTESNS